MKVTTSTFSTRCANPTTITGIPCDARATRLIGKVIKITGSETSGYGEVDTVYNNGDGDMADVTITRVEGLRNE